jgi:hypothetical protein
MLAGLKRPLYSPSAKGFALSFSEGYSPAIIYPAVLKKKELFGKREKTPCPAPNSATDLEEPTKEAAICLLTC